MTTLYKWVVEGVEVYGNKLAVDGANWVMKSVGTDGTLCIVNAESVMEVLPYTVGVRFNSSASGTVYNYFAKEGEVAIGDVVLLSEDNFNKFCFVVAIDTKSRRATKPLLGLVIKGATMLSDPTARAD